MVTMSLETEMAIFGGQVPFIQKRHYMRWPQILEGKNKPNDKWDTLALLLELHNDGTRRTLIREQANLHRKDIVRVASYYNRGDHAGDYDFLIADGVADELIKEHCVEGTPQLGYTDTNKLKITDQGIRALFDYLKAQVK